MIHSYWLPLGGDVKTVVVIQGRYVGLCIADPPPGPQHQVMKWAWVKIEGRSQHLLPGVKRSAIEVVFFGWFWLLWKHTCFVICKLKSHHLSVASLKVHHMSGFFLQEFIMLRESMWDDPWRCVCVCVCVATGAHFFAKAVGRCRAYTERTHQFAWRNEWTETCLKWMHVE